MPNRSQPIKDVQKAAHQMKPGQTFAPPQKDPREPAPYHYSIEELQHKKDCFDASSESNEDMMGAEKGPGCGHPGCNCAVEMGSHYCSDRCQQVAAKAGISCQCGHPECGGPLS